MESEMVGLAVHLRRRLSSDSPRVTVNGVEISWAWQDGRVRDDPRLGPRHEPCQIGFGLRCRCCGASMRIAAVGLPPRPRRDGAPQLPLLTAEAAVM